jgi:glycosyltransferase involved in cell wall biosynthesis
VKQEFRISIIVPLYNEQESFAALVKRIDGVIDTMQVPVEVVLVDDGSKDTTTMLMAEIMAIN